MPIYIIRDFSGGENKASSYRLAPNESADLQHFQHIEGNLQSMWGKKAYHSRTVTDTNTAPIMSHFRWYKTGQAVNNGATTDQTGWLLAKCDGAVWVDTAQVNSTGSARATMVTATFKPICEKTKGYPENFCSYGGYLYMTDNLAPSGTNKRWDGRFCAVGTLSIPTHGTSTVQGVGTKWATGNTNGAVKLGDRLFVKYTTNQPWSLTPRYVMRVTGETGIQCYPTLGTKGSAKYMIAGVGKMGLTTPTTAPTITPTSGSGMATGSYYYKYTYYNAKTGFESNRRENSSRLPD
jgi:hypothetical protein